MPFFKRKKHQPEASALTIHSAEQLSTVSFQQNTRSGSSNPDFYRFSDSRSRDLRTDRQQPLHRPSQSHSYSQAQALQEPIPEPAAIRRTQTAHLLQDPEPVRPSTISPVSTIQMLTRQRNADHDDRRKLQKHQTTKKPPSTASSPPSSTAKDIPSFLGRTLSKSHRSRPATITTAPRGARRSAPKDDVPLNSQSIPEISTTATDSQQLAAAAREGNTVSIQHRTSTSTADSDKLQVQPSKHGSNQTQTQPQSPHQSIRPPSQLSLATSLISAHSDTASLQAMAADRAGPAGQSNQTGRQSPYLADSKNNSSTSQDQGRSTPGPAQGRREEEGDMRSLVQKHEELLAKYSKVKRYYFEKDAQVQHLQNTVAHQRMAVSRTVLDDNEYANRFGRLDGAIKDLAFSIRKDWKSLPHWLIGYVNDDAHTVGMKEMTAIGRAFISRWLVEEIFHRHFHPSLESTFSQQLKSIENNLRQQHGSKSVITEEDKENAIAKISNWRRTTFDGLGDAQLHGRTADENRAKLVDHLVAKLVASLEMHLNTPPPVGMDNGARLIVENAVGVAEKIPLESRDICVEYPLPGSILDDRQMKPETGVPPLTNVKPENVRRPDLESTDPAGQGQSTDTDPTASTDPDSPSSQPPSPTSSPAPGTAGPEKKKTSMLGSLMGKRNTPAAPATQAKESKDDNNNNNNNNNNGAVVGPTRIRFASFVSAEVRGKGPVNVLAKAPVYALE